MLRLKKLQEEQNLHKEALTLIMQEQKTKKIFVEDLGEVTLVEPKPRKSFLQAEAKNI